LSTGVRGRVRELSHPPSRDGPLVKQPTPFRQRRARPCRSGLSLFLDSREFEGHMAIRCLVEHGAHRRNRIFLRVRPAEVNEEPPRPFLERDRVLDPDRKLSRRSGPTELRERGQCVALACALKVDPHSSVTPKIACTNRNGSVSENRPKACLFASEPTWRDHPHGSAWFVLLAHSGCVRQPPPNRYAPSINRR